MKLWVFGSLLGIIAALSPGSVFVLLLVAGTCAALRRLAAQEDRAFLIRWFLIGFSVRAVLSLGLDLGSCIVEGYPPMKRAPVEYWNLGIIDKTRNYMRMGDSDYYSERGYCMAQYVNGVSEPAILRRIQDYGHHGYVFVIGWFYYLFGFSPVSVKWVNGWIGALLILPLFLLAKSCFQSTIARWTAGLVALFPTLIFWSTTNLKEPLFFLFLGFLFLLFQAIRVGHGFRRWVAYPLLLLLLFRALLAFGRQEFLVGLAAGLTLVCCLEWCLRKRWYVPLVLMAVGMVHFAPPVISSGLRLAVYRHIGYVGGTGMVYRYLPDRFYPYTTPAPTQVLVQRIPNAIMHYLLEPFPSRAGDWFVALLVPQMILWYFLLPLALIGAVAGLSWNTWNCAFLVAAFVVWTLMGALSNANIGTLIRLRDMVTPIVLLFAAAGLWVVARGKEDFCRRPVKP